MKQPNFTTFGENAILVSWESAITDAIHIMVVDFDRWVNENCTDRIVETVIGYYSIAIYLKQDVDQLQFIKMLQEGHHSADRMESPEKRNLITIPVCYDSEFAIDLTYVAQHHGISEERVIQLHSQPVYKVHFIGFLPGFPYLGGLDVKLHTPRKETPAKRIAKGSVGIGGNQTGIYPMDSPGGWHIIGRSPLSFFDPDKNTPCPLLPGDSVTFEVITKEEFDHTRILVENGIYQWQKTPYHD